MKRSQNASAPPPIEQWVAVKGINYSVGGIAGDPAARAEIRIEPGETLPAGMSADALIWLRECGAIVPAHQIGGHE